MATPLVRYTGGGWFSTLAGQKAGSNEYHCLEVSGGPGLGTGPLQCRSSPPKAPEVKKKARARQMTLTWFRMECET